MYLKFFIYRRASFNANFKKPPMMCKFVKLCTSILFICQGGTKRHVLISHNCEISFHFKSYCKKTDRSFLNLPRSLKYCGYPMCFPISVAFRGRLENDFRECRQKLQNSPPGLLLALKYKHTPKRNGMMKLQLWSMQDTYVSQKTFIIMVEVPRWWCRVGTQHVWSQATLD